MEKIIGKELKFYQDDILDAAALDKIFTENKIDAVINFAGLKAVGESVEKPVEYYYNNITGMLVLLQAMRRHGCKNLVFSSSATVYGQAEVRPHPRRFSVEHDKSVRQHETVHRIYPARRV